MIISLLRENQILKTVKSYILVLITLLLSSLTSELIGQGSVVITSSDSIPFSIKINTLFETNSLFSDAEFYFPIQKKCYLEVLDSTEQILLESEVGIKQNKIQKFDLKFVSGEWRLLPESIFDLPLEYTDSLNVSVDGTENYAEAIFIIKSEYKSKNNIYQKEINELESLVFERERILAVKHLISQENLSRKETISALETVSYEDNRLEILAEYSTILKSKLLIKDVESLFKLDRYKSKALEFLGL